ncbi:MAG: tyrosine-type recombinase/integrase [Acidobacteriaceae bacterium]
MLHRSHTLARTGRVNLLKKVKVDGAWKLFPAVVESDGRLKDRVRIHGRIEVHSEGVYYMEWREAGRRRREAIPNRAQVLDRARWKALELEARKCGIAAPGSEGAEPVQPNLTPLTTAVQPAVSLNPSGPAAPYLLEAVERYLRKAIHSAVRSQLEALGFKLTGADRQASAAAAIRLPQHLETTQNPESAPAPAEAQRSNGKTLLSAAIKSYLKDVEPPQREPKTYDEYRLVLYMFRDTCGKLYLQDVGRDDCLSFMRHLYSLGNEARTVFNRMGIVLQLLKLHGIEKLLKKGDKPKFVRNVREMYEPKDLEALFRACDADERVLYLFFLLTGERDKEVRYTAWPDIDFTRKCVRVTAKKQLGFKPKDKEEREIPVPSSLLTALREYQSRQSGPNPHHLVFATGGGKADRKFENKLKRIANRAGLNCGRCVSKHGNKCAEGAYCGKWFLHKFRHTYATTCLENGVSIRTLQEWLGHSDLASTMVYLKYVHRKDIQKLVDTSELAELAAHVFESPEATEAPG